MPKGQYQRHPHIRHLSREEHVRLLTTLEALKVRFSTWTGLARALGSNVTTVNQVRHGSGSAAYAARVAALAGVPLETILDTCEGARAGATNLHGEHLTVAEDGLFVASLRNLKRVHGTYRRIAELIGVTPQRLASAINNPRRYGSMALAARVARLANAHVEQVLTPQVRPAGTCWMCGQMLPSNG
jgi:hypothetical protein